MHKYFFQKKQMRELRMNGITKCEMEKQNKKKNNFVRENEKKIDESHEMTGLYKEKT